MSDYANMTTTTFTATKRIYCKDCKYFERFGGWCDYKKYEVEFDGITGIESEKWVDDVGKQLVKVLGKDQALKYDLCAQMIFNKNNNCKLFEQKESEKKNWWSRLWI